jgi:TPR repeat protein
VTSQNLCRRDRYVATKRNQEVRLATFVVYVLVIANLASCASTHNLAEDGSNILGGGFTTEAIRPGLYRLYARGNKALFPDAGAATRTWGARAAQLCGAKAYKEFGIFEGRTTGNEATIVVRGIGPLTFQQHDTSKEGYVLCDSSGLSESQAEIVLTEKLKLEDEQRAQRTATILSEYDPTECSAKSTNKTADYFYLMAKDYLNARKFEVAMSCFKKVASLSSGGDAFRESCFHIGTMYELGHGVSRNEAAAKSWYRKSGDLKD